MGGQGPSCPAEKRLCNAGLSHAGSGVFVRHRPGGRTARLCDRGDIQLLTYYLTCWQKLFAAQDSGAAVGLFLAEYLTVAGALTAVLLLGLSALGPLPCVFVCDRIWYWYRSDQRTAARRISTAAIACLSSIRRYPGGDCRWMPVLIWNFCFAGMLTAAQRLFRRKNPRTNSGECKGIGRTIFVVCSSICAVVRCGNRAFMPAQSTGIVIFKKRRKNNR